MAGWLNRLVQRWGPHPRVVPVLRRVVPRTDRAVLRLTGGRTSVTQLTFPTLTLHTVGRRSGQPRTTPLMYVRDGEDYVVVGTNFGQAHHPAWSHNLLADPTATVTVDGRQVPVVATLIDDRDRQARLWPVFDAMYGGYADYRARASRDIRMFALTPRAQRPDTSG